MLEMLIVDDDYQSYLKQFHTAFKGHVQFSAVDDGLKGLGLVKRTNYSAVILDHDMPHDGYKTAKEIRKIKPHLPLIGFSKVWDEKMASELNMVAYSDKEEDIAKAVAKLCGMDEDTYKKKIKPFFR